MLRRRHDLAPRVNDRAVSPRLVLRVRVSSGRRSDNVALLSCREQDEWAEWRGAGMGVRAYRGMGVSRVKKKLTALGVGNALGLLCVYVACTTKLTDVHLLVSKQKKNLILL